ncbi:hypothetical protein HRR76_009597 [Exophiala dermatitidis]|nr:hypothetical protein HRR76_009597 [Exophiala dermatitidis]
MRETKVLASNFPLRAITQYDRAADHKMPVRSMKMTGHAEVLLDELFADGPSLVCFLENVVLDQFPTMSCCAPSRRTWYQNMHYKRNMLKGKT